MNIRRSAEFSMSNNQKDPKHLIQRARDGDADSALKVGIGLLKGFYGLKRLPESAEEFLKIAADHNLLEGIRKYADIQRSKGNFNEAKEYYQIGIDKHNDPYSMVAYGKIIFDTTHNEEESDRYYKMASDLNYPEGLYLHAAFLYQRNAVNEATELFKKAANMGDCESLHMLHIIDKDNDIYEEEYKKRKKQLQAEELERNIRDADNGDAEAMVWLVEKYKKEPLKRLRMQAYPYMENLTHKGDVPTMRYLATCYKFGRDVEKDPKQYFHYLKMAADHNEVDCMLKVAEYYKTGGIVNVNKEESKKYYQSARDIRFKTLKNQTKTDPSKLADTYEFANQLMHGDGFEKDIKFGVAVLRKVAEKEYPDAIVDFINLLFKSGYFKRVDESEIVKFIQLKKDNNYILELTNQFLAGRLQIHLKGKIIRQLNPDGPLIKFFKQKAIESNNTKVLLRFAQLYKEGKPYLPQNIPECVALLKIVADSGTDASQEAVARLKVMYDNNSMPEDDDKEIYSTLSQKYEFKNLKDRASENSSNNGFAMINYANSIIETSTSEAIAYLQKAAQEKQIPFAMFRLGQIYEKGKYVPKDINKAKEYYEQGQKYNDLLCIFHLVRLLLENDEGDEAVKVISTQDKDFVQNLFSKMKYEWNIDPNDIVQLLKVAADSGNIDSMKILSTYLVNGRNVAHDEEEARKYEEMYQLRQ